MPTGDVLATVKWNTLTFMYKSSLIELFFYHGMLPSTLAEELIIHGDRPSSRLKHGLIAPSFASKYVQNSISSRGAVFWNTIGRSNRSILECTDLKTFWKNVNCHTFNPTNNQQKIEEFYTFLTIDFIRFYQTFIFYKNYFYLLIVVFYASYLYTTPQAC